LPYQCGQVRSARDVHRRRQRWFAERAGRCEHLIEEICGCGDFTVGSSGILLGGLTGEGRRDGRQIAGVQRAAAEVAEGVEERGSVEEEVRVEVVEFRDGDLDR